MNGASGFPSALEVLAFLAELATIALLAASGWLLFPAFPLGVVLAVALPAAFIAVWGRWMAPRSATRLRDPGRLVLQGALFLTAAVLGVAAGIAVWGVGVGLGAIGVFSALSVREARMR